MILSCYTKLTSFLKYWLPVIAWMAIIFSASSDAMSAEHTSRIIGPLIQWLKPDISEESFERMHTIVRKGGHLTEYAILSCLVLRARRKPDKRDPKPWRWPDAFVALLLAAVYAASDEFHQSFVLSREASAADVLIDTAGAGLGLLAVWRLGRLFRKW